MGRKLAVALTDEPGISYTVLTDLAEPLVPDVASARWSCIQPYRGNKRPHLCIVRRSLRSCIDGRGRYQKRQYQCHDLHRTHRGWSPNPDQRFSRLGLIEGRVCRLPTVTIRAGAPTGAAFISAPTITVLPMSRHQENCICSPRTRIRNLMVAGKIPKEQCGISSAVVLPGTKGAYRRPYML